MLEMISIIASLAICIITPIEVAKIRRGWIRRKFGTDRVAFITAYQRQLKLLTWLGGVFGVLSLLTALLENEPQEAVLKLVGTVIWAAVGVICFVSRRQLQLPCQHRDT